MSEDDKTYHGPENRAEIRRVKQDRRLDIRFEPGKDDRRQSPGRRKEDKDSNLWRTYDT